MKREVKKITESGSYEFGNNYQLIFKNDINDWLNDCNITFGNNCEIECGWDCNITCGDECVINCGKNCIVNCKWLCNIICGNDCEIKCAYFCYIKAGEGSQLKPYGDFFKTISNDEEFIWWYYDFEIIPMFINTYEDVDWKNENVDKWNEFYAFVHNELDSATLF